MGGGATVLKTNLGTNIFRHEGSVQAVLTLCEALAVTYSTRLLCGSGHDKYWLR